MLTFTACRIKETASAGETTENLGFIGGNIAAGGLMGGDRNGWVYYRSEADSWKLYKARLDGTKKTWLSDDCPCYINVLEGWVYYSNYRDNFSLYRIRADGTERHKLIDGYCCNLYVTDSGMYFDMRDKNNSAQIYHMELDGSAPELLVADMQVAAYYDGVLYCRSTNKLCAYNMQTGTLSNIREKYTHNVCADETGIYYWAVDKNTFCHIGFSGQEQVLLTGGDFFNYTEGKLYYFGYGGNNHDYYCIYCLDVKSKTTSAVLSLSDQCFDISGNLLGITIAQVRDSAAELDESYFDNDEGVFNGFSEQAGYTYVIEDSAFCRGGLRESILSTGKLGCWILYDNNGGIVWD
ncbi:MAG TPA: hypothetical protein DHD79_09830 [Firmicutes bacterium]|jgi:hypothetical protein|nr:hypothetical protein [Bacillota bacterium]HCA29408.1 hypothetical protein [Oscillospiraceae bacterium]HBL50675.1 hypothetical protein [Bacillota bacterium]HBL67753.1 hypothetical protein [Bacillota bacterium]HCF89475.1 hypothetical protein [Bacillota bacterium]